MDLVRHHHRVSRLLGNGLYKDRLHPVYNFLFEYYHFKHKILFQYSYGIHMNYKRDHQLKVLSYIDDQSWQNDRHMPYSARLDGLGE